MICKDNWRTEEEAKDVMEGEGSFLSRSLEDLSDAGVQLSSEVEHLLRGLSSLGSSGVEVVVEHLQNTREGGGKRVSGRALATFVLSLETRNVGRKDSPPWCREVLQQTQGGTELPRPAFRTRESR